MHAQIQKTKLAIVSQRKETQWWMHAQWNVNWMHAGSIQQFRQFQLQEHTRKRLVHNIPATATAAASPLQVSDLDLKNEILFSYQERKQYRKMSHSFRSKFYIINWNWRIHRLAVSHACIWTSGTAASKHCRSDTIANAATAAVWW